MYFNYTGNTIQDVDTRTWFVVSFKYTFDYGAESRTIDRTRDYELVDEEGEI